MIYLFCAVHIFISNRQKYFKMFVKGDNTMQLSARNQIKGKISAIKEGPVSTEVVLDVNGMEIVSSITTGSAKSLNLKVGDEASAVIKASSVMIAK
jgi:molybdopterin-binding protein